MIRHDLQQGSPEWHAHRANFRNASDAPAMMGESPYMTRAELLRRVKTGITPDVDAQTQRRFDDGHRFEALARPLAETIIGEDLYPVVGSNGLLSASFDGLTMCEDVAFEHKSLNAELRDWFSNYDRADIESPANRAGKDLPAMYRIQMQQQIMVSGAERVLFVASKWDGDTLVEEHHCWYFNDEDLAERIRQGWVQFERDLVDYTAPETTAPAPTGRAPDTLPALLITVRGEVTASNLQDFKETALTAIRSVNRDLKTDQDFADADKAVKWCDDIEKRVAGAKQHALSQTATIDQLFKAMDDISAEARQVRLDLSKLVAARKVSLKTELLTEAQTALREHVAALNTRLGHAYMPQVTADFASAIHGKKNFDSMRAALNATLANAKIEASGIADRIQTNLNTLRELASAHAFLFADTSTIVLKAPDDLTALVKNRLAEHQAAEAAKEESTRQRIEAEAKVKAEREARETIAREQREAAAAQKLIDDAAALAAKQAEAAAAALSRQQAADAAALVAQQATPAPAQIASASTVVPDLQPVAAPAVVQMFAPRPAAAPAAAPTLRLGQIAERLGFTVTADFLKTLGFEAAGRDRAAVLYHEADFSHICAALVDHITLVQAQPKCWPFPKLIRLGMADYLQLRNPGQVSPEYEMQRLIDAAVSSHPSNTKGKTA